jgi:hypothetical protein
MQARKRSRVWLQLLLLACAALVHRASCEEEPQGGEALKPLQLMADTLQSTLASLPSDSYLLVELFACVSWCLCAWRQETGVAHSPLPITTPQAVVPHLPALPTPLRAGGRPLQRAAQ